MDIPIGADDFESRSTEYGRFFAFFILALACTLWTAIAAPTCGHKYLTRYIYPVGG